MIRPASLTDLKPNIVAASPLSWRQIYQQEGGYKKLRRTSSDHVGVRGLIHAFGLISGLQELPDLLDPGDYETEVGLSAANLYSNGSPKANGWTGLVLSRFCQTRKPKFTFKPDPDSEDLIDVHIDLHVNGRKWLPPGLKGSDRRVESDFGLVIRGPHPNDSGSLIMVLAGRGAVETEAACLAVTDVKHLRQLTDRLRLLGIDLNDHKQAFWAVVEMERDIESGETLLNSLRICEAERFRDE